MESNKLCGYALLQDYGSYMDFKILKTNPIYEKLAINVTIIAQILKEYNNRLEGELLYM